MKTLALAAFIIGSVLLAVAQEKEQRENTLEIWANRHQKDAAPTHPTIAVSAFLKREGGRHLLAFKLTNLSREPIELYPSELPWRHPFSTVVAGVTIEGKRLPNIYEIADRPIEKRMRIAAGASLEGDYDLAYAIELNPETMTRDVLILWSYRLPTRLPDAMPVCSGVVVIPKGR